MAAVTVQSNFGAQENKICHGFHFSPSIYLEVMGLETMILVFWMLSFKSSFPLSSSTFIKSLFSYSSLSSTRVVSSAYLRLLMFLQPILLPDCNSSSMAFLMMCSANRLNKQGDSRQPCHTPFSTLNQSVAPYRVLMVAPWPAYRFLRREIR